MRRRRREVEDVVCAAEGLFNLPEAMAEFTNRDRPGELHGVVCPYAIRKDLAAMMDNIIDHRSEWIERRHRHVADLRKRATEADQRLQRLYASIEQGVVDPAGPSLKQRMIALKKVRDKAEGDAQHAAASIDQIMLALTPDLLRRFAEATREMFGDNNGAYRRDLIRAVAQKVELISPEEVRICGSKGSCSRL